MNCLTFAVEGHVFSQFKRQQIVFFFLHLLEAAQIADALTELRSTWHFQEDCHFLNQARKIL